MHGLAVSCGHVCDAHILTHPSWIVQGNSVWRLRTKENGMKALDQVTKWWFLINVMVEKNIFWPRETTQRWAR